MVCATCPALISLLMVGARRVVIQRSPSLPCRSSRIRAPVSIPRSPTSTTRCSGAGVHYAFEAIGVASEPYLNSVRCTRRRGVTVWVGHAPLNTPVQLDARDLFFEKTVIGSFYGSARTHVDFLRILALYREGKLLLDELVSSRLPLEQVNTAFESLAQGDVARSVLIME